MIQATGNLASTHTLLVEAAAHGISLQSPWPHVQPAQITIQGVLPIIPWIGSLAWTLIAPVLLVAHIKTRHLTWLLASNVVKIIKCAKLWMVIMVTRSALMIMVHACTNAIRLPWRPCRLLHASHVPPLTLAALPTIPLTGRAAWTPTTPASMAAHGLSTTRSLLWPLSLDASSSEILLIWTFSDTKYDRNAHMITLPNNFLSSLKIKILYYF